MMDFGFGFDVAEFNLAQPFAILDNIPFNNPCFEIFHLLCKVYDLAKDSKQLQKLYPQDWTAALVCRYPDFDLVRFSNLLRINIVHPYVTPQLMMKTRM
jgi:hypothetical protein